MTFAVSASLRWGLWWVGQDGGGWDNPFWTLIFELLGKGTKKSE
jgi:hypothetical protein